MAIEKTYLLGKNITLGCGFDLQAKAPLDSRQTVPYFAGLQALIDNNAAYEGMIVYDEETKKTYQAQMTEDVLKFREFGLTAEELKNLIASETTAAMEFKGTAAALPENPAKGDMYKVTATFKIGEEDVKVGDSIVYDGTQWFIIPSGDDIEDTWRPVTGVNNDATLTFAAGDKLEKTVAADGTITYKHVAIDAPTNMNEEGDEQTRTYITQLITDNHGHVIGFKTATENVTNTDTTYTFEGIPTVEGEAAPSSVYFQVTSSEEGATAEVIYIDAYTRNEADGKFVEKVDGKQLSDENFTAELLAKLNGIAEEANKYEHAEYTAYENGFYKVTVDSEGHVSNAVAVTKEDIVALGIPGQDTTYEKATADADGLMSKEHFAKVEGIAAGAQVNVIESVKVNGTALTIDGKAVNIEVPTGALAGKDKVAKTDLADALATEIDNKVASVGAGDASITVGGTATAPTVAVKLSAAEGNAIELAEDGLKVIIPESTKVEASETDGNIKVDGKEVTVYKHVEKHAISDVDGLQDALNGLQAKGDYAAAEHTHTASEITDFATEVAKVKVAEATKADAAAKVDNALTVKVGGVDVVFDGSEAKTADIDTELAKKADKGVVDKMYTNTQIDELVQGAKEYADNNDADTKYGIVYDSENKKIKLVENGTEAEIDATDFIKDGMIETVALSEDGLNLVITWNTDSDKGENNVTTIPLTGLVDIYTGVDGARINVAVSSDKKISAEIVAGSISKNYLDDGVQASLAKADSALQAHQDISHLATTEALNGVNARFDSYTTTTDLNAALELKADKTQVATDIATAKEEAITEASSQDAVVLSESQKYSDQVKAEAIADAASKYETKGTAQGIVDGLKLSETYEAIGAETRAINAAKSETEKQVGELAKTLYTKDEVDSLLSEATSWGEF